MDLHHFRLALSQTELWVLARLSGQPYMYGSVRENVYIRQTQYNFTHLLQDIPHSIGFGLFFFVVGFPFASGGRVSLLKPVVSHSATTDESHLCQVRRVVDL